MERQIWALYFLYSDLAESIRKKSGLDAKVCILGHQQRCGAPTANDRILAIRMGVDALMKGVCNVMIGIDGKNLVQVPFEAATGTEKKNDPELISLSYRLAR